VPSLAGAAIDCLGGSMFPWKSLKAMILTETGAERRRSAALARGWSGAARDRRGSQQGQEFQSHVGPSLNWPPVPRRAFAVTSKGTASAGG
jgi:hypothetical protein